MSILRVVRFQHRIEIVLCFVLCLITGMKNQFLNGLISFFFFGKTTKLLDKKQAVVEAVNDNMVKWLIIDNVGG